MPKKKQSPENEETARSELTIGALLKQERERKGLSYAQISEVTKLRPSVLEALENESWEDLPSPVFVNGFVRSYGLALDLEEEKVTALFLESAPAIDSTPKPLVEPVRNKKTSLVILIFVLLAIGSAYFFWKGYSTHKKVLDNPVTLNLVQKSPEHSQKIQETQTETESVIPSEEHSSDFAPKPVTQNHELKSINHLMEKDESSTNDFSSNNIPGNMSEPQQILKINTREKTWLRIYIDDQEPKEYTLRPEEHAAWKAKKGFELLIGNAAGIDLELNGEQIKDVGTPGQVIRLSLPEGYKRRHLKE